MGVGTSGVNIAKPGASRAPGFYDTVAAIASDPKLFAQNQQELLRLIGEQEKLLSARAKLDDIDRLRDEAEAHLAKARSILHDADEEAKSTVASGLAEVEKVRENHKKEVRKDRASLDTRRKNLKAREDKLEQRAVEIDPLYEAARAEYEKSQKATQQAERMKSSFEAKLQLLKKTIREVEK